MTEKLKIKFLTVIWGARYIEEFARVSMPSYLASGNLPFLAKEADLEIVILTSKQSRQTFDDEPIFARLEALCPLRYIYIDDLITTGVYGVTLTLAYARGILDSGPEQTNTHFVFMNSDFLLADGSLRTLLGKLRDGHRCVMAPSLRVRAEAVAPTLAKAVNAQDNTLAMAPRDMVHLAFDNLHPTVMAKTVTQDFVTCATHNQIYWQVDRTTLLVRHHLIFMLAIKPEVPMGPVNSYCDYGFVPELVPSGQFTILGDSDEFLMLELQPAGQEKQFLRCGTSRPAEIASELSVWTTREHRRFAEVDIVFHSDDLPAERLATERARLGEFVADIHERMPEPKNHVDHFYWTSGVQAWTTLKYPEPDDVPEIPPELGEGTARRSEEGKRTAGFVGQVSQLLYRAYMNCIGRARRAAGVLPHAAWWHHLWLDSRLILEWLKSIGPHFRQKNLLVCDEDSPLPVSLGRSAPFEVRIGLDAFVRASCAPASPPMSDGSELYDNAIVHTRRANVRRAGEILEVVGPRVRSGGMIALYVENPGADLDMSNFSYELAQRIEDILPAGWMDYRLETRFAGGAAKRYLRRTERYLFKYLIPSTTAKLPLLILSASLWPFVALLTGVNNFLMRNRSSACPKYCSSVLLSLKSRT